MKLRIFTNYIEIECHNCKNRIYIKREGEISCGYCGCRYQTRHAIRRWVPKTKEVLTLAPKRKRKKPKQLN